MPEAATPSTSNNSRERQKQRLPTTPVLRCFFRSFSFPYSVYIPLVGHAFTEQQTNTFDGSSSLRPETETERSVVPTVHE